MTKEEYIEAKKRAGHRLHLNDGVWWETDRAGYCKTAIRYEAHNALEVKPKFAESYKGYNHRVYDERQAKSKWTPLIMNEEKLQNWSLTSLESGNRRRRIKKGLKNNVVKLVEDINPLKEEFVRVLKSTAIRNGHGNPPEFYDMNKSEWWKVIDTVAHYSEFWCAFQDDKLAAYISLQVMGDRVIVDGVKSDTDMLPGCPMDAIIYNFLMDLQGRGGIKEIWYGGKSDRPTLDKFKESFGFEIVEVPYTIRMLGGLIKYPSSLKK